MEMTTFSVLIKCQKVDSRFSILQVVWFQTSDRKNRANDKN